MKKDQAPLLIAGAALIILLAGGWYGYDRETKLSGAKATIAEMTSTLKEQETSLLEAQSENKDLNEALLAERTRNDQFAAEIEKLSGTVGKLDKLSRTDPELLQKYSKIYFLNENYAPETIEEIPTQYIYGSEDEYISGQVWPYLKDLLEEADEDNVDLRVISAFRSFNTQAALKAQYKVVYGAGANAFSADQGYSEHQLGTTVDFTTPTIGSSFTGFDSSEAFQWLEDNAYKYGFILSYPPNNKYYQYEPWHWRFVGKELARDLHQDDKYFYDLDQRALDTYLVNIFD